MTLSSHVDGKRKASEPSDTRSPKRWKKESLSPATGLSVEALHLGDAPAGLLIEAEVDARESDFDKKWASVRKAFHEAGLHREEDVETLEFYRRCLKSLAKYHRIFDLPPIDTIESESPRAYFTKLTALCRREKASLNSVVESREWIEESWKVQQKWGRRVAAMLPKTAFDHTDINRAVRQALDEDFWAKRPATSEAAKYRVLYEQLMTGDWEVPLPPGLAKASLEDMTCEQYCEQLAFDLRMAPVHSEWAERAERVAPRDRQAYHEAFVQMQREVKAGLPPYGPPPGTGRNSRLSHLPVRDDIPGRWQWRARIGEGGGGFVSVWQHVDDHGGLIERMAVKEILLNDPIERWNLQANWEGDIANRLPKEYAIARYLTSRGDDADNIVKPIAYGIYAKHRLVRLYAEYCDFYDWQTFIDSYRNHTRARERRREHGFVPVPLRALWALFDHLSTAIRIMHRGRHSGHTVSQEEHRSVLHRDLKPGNIFRATSSHKDWPGIPTSKVGDFGLATWLDDEDTQIMTGTMGWFAPEVHTYNRENWEIRSATNSRWDPDRYAQIAIDEKSQVWAVGRIIRAAMLQEPVGAMFGVLFDTESSQLSFRPNAVDNYGRLKPNQAREVFGEVLCGLVERCLEQYPDERIGVDELWREVQKEVHAVVQETGQSWKSMGRRKDEVWIEQKDKYLDLVGFDDEGGEWDSEEDEWVR